MAGAPAPVVLRNQERDFVVIGSTIPYEATVEDANSSWPTVERPSETARQDCIILVNQTVNLAPGIYDNGLRITLINPRDEHDADYFIIPLKLIIGEPSSLPLLPLPDGLGSCPQRFQRPPSNSSFYSATIGKTPGGHYVISIAARDAARAPAGQRASNGDELGLKPQGADTFMRLDQFYPVVFPWLCLEICSLGRTQEVERQEVVQHLDAVNAVSFERYSMGSGSWSVLSVTDPSAWITANALPSWPMVIGSSSTASVTAMYNNRAAIASSMISEAGLNGYSGFCIDVEGTADSATRADFISLVDYLAQQVHQHDVKLMVCHATWSTIAPMTDLSGTAVDYVATMDTYISNQTWYQDYVEQDYQQISPARLIWGFCWEYFDATSQQTQWQWMADSGFNNGVAGAAVWRTPCYDTNGIDYYAGFKTFYPIAGPATATPVATATATPTQIPPTPTPNPTPTPPPEIDVDLLLSNDSFRAGDLFLLLATISNNSSIEYHNYPLVIVLEAFGHYYWYPQWIEGMSYELIDIGSESIYLQILMFTWPDTQTSASGLTFYGAVLDPGLTSIVGEWDAAAFSWE